MVLTELAKREGADWPRFDARIRSKLDCSTEPSTSDATGSKREKGERDGEGGDSRGKSWEEKIKEFKKKLKGM
jgi:hypothetical protein